MEQRAFENVNYCLNTNIYSYLETSGGQSPNLFIFSTLWKLIIHLWQHKTVIDLHWCLIRGTLLWPDIWKKFDENFFLRKKNHFKLKNCFGSSWPLPRKPKLKNAFLCLCHFFPIMFLTQLDTNAGADHIFRLELYPPGSANLAMQTWQA